MKRYPKLATTIISSVLSLSLIYIPTGDAQAQGPSTPKSKFHRVSEPIKGKYIVALKDDIAAESITSMADEMVSTYRGKIKHKYMRAIKGFAAEMSEADAERLSHDPRVDFVEEDGVMSGDTPTDFVEEDGVVSGDAQTSQNTTAATWGLDRIDQRNLPLNNLYSYGSSGFGVNAYVIDSGIRATHQEFAGRAVSDRDFVGTDGADCNGHGTHVAGILGGRTFGVAKEVRIHSLRVFDCTNKGSTSNVIAAVDWVRANYIKPAVTNMSLGGSNCSGSDLLDNAVRSLITAGIPVVVAAGNCNIDAAGQSPARVTEAITVGATNNTDTRSSFSNFGPVVDVFAPGSSITSAWIGSDTATNTISGTSMATPHAAGMVARYLETDPYASPLAIGSLIIRNATAGVVGNPGTGSPNRMLYTVAPKPIDQRYGDFNGDHKEDILVQSVWGIGMLTYNGSTLTSLMVAPNGTWFGGWRYNSATDHIVAIADFNGDHRDDILIASAWGLGMLTYNGSSLSSVMVAPNETWFGGWRFQSGVNQIAGTADFNGDGRQDIVITSAWGMGILTYYGGSSLTSLMVVPSETWFGGWRFQSLRNSFVGYGDFNGDGRDDVLIQSAWGVGILTFNGVTLTPLMVTPSGTQFGAWTLNSKTNRIAGIGHFSGGPKSEILITSNSGLAILGWNGSTLTSLTKASNGARLGGWLLDTKVNYIGRIGDVNDIFKTDIVIRSGWGIGILSLNGSTLTTLMLAPNGTRFGGWLYSSANDQILGVGKFDGSLTNQLLVTSGWGIGILSFSNASLYSLMLAPNGAWFGGWHFNSTVNQVGIYGDIY